ncbi:MAG TPA: Rrf2 family transcriptional regulator [Verrucomicrobiae bacterium]|nr:Rrf2 family transcriptional regulator [Verrucomicrobiae bacterium]
MKVSSQEEYGLRCMLQLARRQREIQPHPLTLAEVARDEGLTVAYVAKLVRRLRRAGLVKSVLGRSGGYTLARPAAEISVLEILGALGGKLYTSDYCRRFAGERTTCMHMGDCSIRSLWGVVEGLLERVLGATMLKDLLGSEKRVGDVLGARAPGVMPITRATRG